VVGRRFPSLGPFLKAPSPPTRVGVRGKTKDKNISIQGAVLHLVNIELAAPFKVLDFLPIGNPHRFPGNWGRRRIDRKIGDSSPAGEGGPDKRHSYFFSLDSAQRLTL
jgi:hypothetical protein